MDLSSIGRHIREARRARNMRQEDLAERTGLSVNYVGVLERGEKLPSLETFLELVNALEISADQVLSDVLAVGYQVKSSTLGEALAAVSPRDREMVCDVVEALLRHTAPGKPQRKN